MASAILKYDYVSQANGLALMTNILSYVSMLSGEALLPNKYFSYKLSDISSIHFIDLIYFQTRA